MITISPALRDICERYEWFHQERRNRRVHVWSVPIISFATVGLTSRIELGSIDGGILLIIVNGIFLLKLDRGIIWPFLGMIWVWYWLAGFVSTPVLWLMWMGGQPELWLIVSLKKTLLPLRI